MLSTEELKKYICNEIQGVLGEVSCSNLFFDEGTNDSIEGTYIFNKNNEYHILFTEKGKIRSDIVTNEKREVLWNAVGIFSVNIIMDFAILNREKGKDFRRALFAKEKEIFSLFGKDFEKRKNKEIEEILEKNPYNDLFWYLCIEHGDDAQKVFSGLQVKPYYEKEITFTELLD